MEPFDWQRMLIGEDQPWYFVFEIVLRTMVMYTVMVLFFKITGKTGIRQLSAFDLILIIGLGSAAGDPMFYDDVPLLHAVTVFGTILGLYLIVNKITQRSSAADKALEGEATCVLRDGLVDYPTLMSEGLTLMQFQSELRQAQVTHLGQVRLAYIETNGETSIFFVKDEEVRPGLPILPELLNSERIHVTEGYYSCVKCGYTEEFEKPVERPCCPRCKGEKWLASWDERRVG